MDGTARSRLRLRARIPDRVRLRLRTPEPRTAATRRMLPLAVLVVAVVTHGIGAKPIASIGDTSVVATRVLVLRDGSGSMGGTGPTLAAQMRTALDAGIEIVAEVRTFGFGMSAAGDPQNALRALEARLPSLDVDAVYLFSDFDNQTGSLDDSDADGLGRLRALLAADGIRLYLATVRRDPERGLVAIAEASGGGVIGAARP